MNAIDIDTSHTAAARKVAMALSAQHGTNSAVRTNKQAATAAAATGGTSTTTTDASTITSSDFLTLLVSELQNQDPTQPTDPNAYITQLVGVNSLQQLISIDQGVTALDPTTTTSSGSVSMPVDKAI